MKIYLDAEELRKAIDKAQQEGSIGLVVEVDTGGPGVRLMCEGKA